MSSKARATSAGCSWDLDYSDPANITPKFFRASLVDGVMTVPPPNSGEVRG